MKNPAAIDKPKLSSPANIHRKNNPYLKFRRRFRKDMLRRIP